MSILHTARAILINDLYVGGPTGYGASIYSGQAPQDETGYFVVLHLISSSEGHTHDGPNGFVRGRLQVDAHSETYEKAHALARAVHNALDGFAGRHPQHDLSVAYVEQDRTYDLPNYTPTGSNRPASCGVAVDFMFAHHQQALTNVPA